MAEPMVDEALAALNGLAEAWRGDWSGFDGRTLRNEIHEWETLFRRALAGEAEPGEAADWLRSEGVCPVCGCWWDYCSEPPEHKKPARVTRA